MGVPYIDHRVHQLTRRRWLCRKCRAIISSLDYMIDDQFVSNSGKAALFEKVTILYFLLEYSCKPEF